ncbi:AbrB/MazE/SpoVT family DNA-binding domain-containing protein [Nesterenkonia alkaliphila]|uniref:AbrB/MazE/SpoVT family DNA-binding domain-containing protein n=1 Tax=Nesterenkonia alkaliphila TaxID=1463631 RepID=A0A7K1UIU9_9MICC|nr:AbrB/MazE/SpoVT family DNA-binding domain-containing protein [Nesterenkonia alkaliphila]MVT26292.1 AbrB/MazE/SpoVT family DNA-binding domain-containing protein [Nesterenkonia alkaliphila]GFZ97339.1 hypothetical protein GCM10011359_28360 [Nesterenkonia alkaliphila]
MGTTHAVKMGDRGRLVVPADLRQRQQWDQGTPLVLVETDDGVLVATREQMKARVRKQLGGPSLVDELAKERRAEAVREDADYPGQSLQQTGHGVPRS